MTDSPIRGVGANLPHVNGDMDRLDRGLAQIAEAGGTFAELCPPALDVIVGARLNPERLRRVEAICRKRGLRYTVHAPMALNFMDEANLPRHVAVADAMLAFCEAIGADVAVVHPGAVPPEVAAAGLERALATERRVLQDLAPVAGARGVAICLENQNPDDRVLWGRRVVYALDPRRLAAQIRAIDRPNVGGTIDVSHACLAAAHLGFDVAEALAAFAPLVRHLHIHDSCGRPGAVEADRTDQIAYGEGDLHLPLGWGTIDFEALLPPLAVRPDTALIVEFNPRYWTELAAGIRRAEACAALVGRSALELNPAGIELS
jgi:sugar phosphate isomerase/epimerase